MHTDSTIERRLPAALGNRLLLDQGLEVLGSIAVAAYAEAPPGHSSVGAQFRHVIDHYEAFFTGLAMGRVDYDARQREPGLERDPGLAATAMRRWHEALGRLERSVADTPLAVQADSGALGGAADWRASSVGRELQFLASHTTHHYALIALLLERAGAAVPPGLGYAPSTRNYLATTR
jgi:uncharacterized damage-inducible protein DinB